MSVSTNTQGLSKDQVTALQDMIHRDAGKNPVPSDALRESFRILVEAFCDFLDKRDGKPVEPSNTLARLTQDHIKAMCEIMPRTPVRNETELAARAIVRSDLER